MGTRIARFAGYCAATIAVTGFGLAAVFGARGRSAIALSAAVAFGVQLLSFAAAWRFRRSNLFAVWGLGTLARFLVLAVYGLVIVRAVGFPPEAALLSLVVFFFLSTLLEPWLLRS